MYQQWHVPPPTGNKRGLEAVKNIVGKKSNSTPLDSTHRNVSPCFIFNVSAYYSINYNYPKNSSISSTKLAAGVSIFSIRI